MAEENHITQVTVKSKDRKGLILGLESAINDLRQGGNFSNLMSNNNATHMATFTKDEIEYMPIFAHEFLISLKVKTS